MHTELKYDWQAGRSEGSGHVGDMGWKSPSEMGLGSMAMRSCTPDSGPWLPISSSPWICRHRVSSHNSYNLSISDILQRQKNSSEWGRGSLRTQGRSTPDSGLGFKGPPSPGSCSGKGDRKKGEWERGQANSAVQAQEDALKVKCRIGEWRDRKVWSEVTSPVSYLCFLTGSHSSQGMSWWRGFSPRQRNWAHQSYSTPIHQHLVPSPREQRVESRRVKGP